MIPLGTSVCVWAGPTSSARGVDAGAAAAVLGLYAVVAKAAHAGQCGAGVSTTAHTGLGCFFCAALLRCGRTRRGCVRLFIYLQQCGIYIYDVQR